MIFLGVAKIIFWFLKIWIVYIYIFFTILSFESDRNHQKSFSSFFKVVLNSFFSVWYRFSIGLTDLIFSMDFVFRTKSKIGKIWFYQVKWNLYCALFANDISKVFLIYFEIFLQNHLEVSFLKGPHFYPSLIKIKNCLNLNFYNKISK